MPSYREASGTSGVEIIRPASLVDVSDLGRLRDRVHEILVERGVRELDEPIELSSGQMSRYFIDGKEALARGADLRVACRAMLAAAGAEGIEFTAAGGLTLGADQFAHGLATLSGCRWFVVRKSRKGRGTNKLIEGARIGSGDQVIVVDDIVSTGGSIREAYEAVVDTGAEVVLVTTLADRGAKAAEFFADEDVPYRPLLTYEDLDLDPVTGTEDA